LYGDFLGPKNRLVLDRDIIDSSSVDEVATHSIDLGFRPVFGGQQLHAVEIPIAKDSFVGSMVCRE